MNETKSKMDKTATKTNFFVENKNKQLPYDEEEKPIDRSKAKSQAFKSLSRSELNKIKGTRPRYEENFQNDFNRYNVKYLDAKIKG